MDSSSTPTFSNEPELPQDGGVPTLPEGQEFSVDETHPIQFGSVAADSPEGLEKQRELANDMTATFQSWLAWRRPLEALWGEIYAMYMEVLRGQKAFTRARVFIPVAFQIIETAVPKLMNVVLGNTTFFEVQPESPDQDAN